MIFFDFAHNFPSTFDILKIAVPIGNSSNRWFHFYYFLPQFRILIINRFTSLILLKCSIFTNSRCVIVIVSWVQSLSLHSTFLSVSNVQNMAHKILVTLHLIILFHYWVITQTRRRHWWMFIYLSSVYCWWYFLSTESPNSWSGIF
jgi:hypothetical protein